MKCKWLHKLLSSRIYCTEQERSQRCGIKAVKSAVQDSGVCVWHCAFGSVGHGDWDCQEPLLRIHWQLHQKRGNARHNLSPKDWWCLFCVCSSLTSEELWLEQTADDGLISCWFFSHQTASMCVNEMENTFHLMKKVQANFLIASFWKIIHFDLFNIVWCYSGSLSNTLLKKYEEGKKHTNTVWHVILKYLTNDVRLSFCM